MPVVRVRCPRRRRHGYGSHLAGRPAPGHIGFMRIARTYFLHLVLVFVLVAGTLPAMAAHAAMTRDNGVPIAFQLAYHAGHLGMGQGIERPRASDGEEDTGSDTGDGPGFYVCKIQCPVSGTESLSPGCAFRCATRADQIHADRPLFPRSHVMPPPARPPKAAV